MKLSLKEERRVLTDGAAWAVREGYGTPEDLEATEDGGVMHGPIRTR
jgi:tRNA-splicing ligase RtcB